MALVTGANVPQFVQEVSLNAASVAANSVATEAFTITGIRTNTMYRVDCLSLDAGLFVIGSYPTANNELTLVFFNPSNAAINPGALTYRILGF